MKISKNGEEFELDFYLQIIDLFQDEEINREKKRIWINKSIIELMKYLKRTRNRRLVANALILILSLFEDLPPDLYNNRGVNINRISQKDKEFLIKDLKEEFLPN
ncbi:MAG: hypothetical protein ACFFEY_02555 [Candidatus Thorarchaeota archaeon]